MNKEGLRVKEMYVVGYFPSFFVIILSINEWLVQGSNMNKKEYNSVSWLYVFVRMSLSDFFLCLKKVLIRTLTVAS